MKTFLSDLIPKLQRFSQKLDNNSLLQNQNWVLLDENNNKTVYIFRSNKQLLISLNGIVEKGNWEYLNEKTLLIDRKDSSYIFKHGFFDENILAMKIDGLNEYVFFINESKSIVELNSIENVENFLVNKYMNNGTSKIIIDDLPLETLPNFKIDTIINSIPKSTSTKIINIEFHNGDRGSIIVDDLRKSYYFEEDRGRGLLRRTIFHYYIGRNYCINALYVFLQTKSISNVGYMYSG
ncbi:MAG TPA: hypothetical protein VGB84_06465 [Arachidicoccus sp.]